MCEREREREGERESERERVKRQGREERIRSKSDHTTCTVPYHTACSG